MGSSITARIEGNGVDVFQLIADRLSRDHQASAVERWVSIIRSYRQPIPPLDQLAHVQQSGSPLDGGQPKGGRQRTMYCLRHSARPGQLVAMIEDANAPSRPSPKPINQNHPPRSRNPTGDTIIKSLAPSEKPSPEKKQSPKENPSSPPAQVSSRPDQPVGMSLENNPDEPQPMDTEKVVEPEQAVEVLKIVEADEPVDVEKPVEVENPVTEKPVDEEKLMDVEKSTDVEIPMEVEKTVDSEKPMQDGKILLEEKDVEAEAGKNVQVVDKAGEVEKDVEVQKAVQVEKAVEAEKEAEAGKEVVVDKAGEAEKVVDAGQGMELEEAVEEKVFEEKAVEEKAMETENATGTTSPRATNEAPSAMVIDCGPGEEEPPAELPLTASASHYRITVMSMPESFELLLSTTLCSTQASPVPSSWSVRPNVVVIEGMVWGIDSDLLELGPEISPAPRAPTPKRVARKKEPDWWIRLGTVTNKGATSANVGLPWLILELECAASPAELDPSPAVLEKVMMALIEPDEKILVKPLWLSENDIGEAGLASQDEQLPIGSGLVSKKPTDSRRNGYSLLVLAKREGLI